MLINRKILILVALVIAASCAYLLIGFNPQMASYFLARRVPRLVAMMTVGVALTMATGLFQTISQNHILTPNLLGYDRMYGFIQTVLVFILSSSSLLVNNGVFNFILVASLMILFSTLFYRQILSWTKNNIFLLLLIGTVVATFFGSISSFLQMIIDPNEYVSLQNQLYASFNQMNTEILPLALLLMMGCIIWIYRQSDKMDVMGLGNKMATNLGIDVPKFQLRSLIVVSILISIQTALIGPFDFIGLLVINLVRQKTKGILHRKLLADASLLAILFLIVGQTMIERVFQYSVTITVFVNLIGGLYMMTLLLKEK